MPNEAELSDNRRGRVGSEHLRSPRRPELSLYFPNMALSRYDLMANDPKRGKFSIDNILEMAYSFLLTDYYMI